MQHSSSSPSVPYGVGLAYRAMLHRQVMHFADEIDLLEIPTEDYIIRERRVQMDARGTLLREALDRFACVAHGISMSIGSVEEHDEAYLTKTRDLLDETGMEVFSEHLAFHRMEGKDLSVFLSMPFEEVSVRWLAGKYEHAKAVLGRPFALENVSYYFPIPHGRLDEADFLCKLLEATDCTLLLDVTNIYNNAQNHGYDAREFLHRLPGDRISQLHLAGGHVADGMLQDSHSSPVFDEVWELYDEVLRHTAANVVILERDSNFRPFAAVVDDLRKAREIFYRHRPRRPPIQRPAPTSGEPPRGPRPDPSDEQFVGLRAFQQALLRQITSAEFRRSVARDRAAAISQLAMSPDWVARWADCDQQRILYLAEKWKGVERHRRETAVAYRRFELQQWIAREGMT